MPHLLGFDRLPAPTQDRPAAERCLGTPPLRTTWSVFENPVQGVDCGEWACEPGAWRIAFHAGRQEFFQVLEGQLRIVAEEGTAREYGPGDACVIPPGFCGVFEVLTPVHKRYVMIDAPQEPTT